MSPTEMVMAEMKEKIKELEQRLAEAISDREEWVGKATNWKNRCKEAEAVIVETVERQCWKHARAHIEKHKAR